MPVVLLDSNPSISQQRLTTFEAAHGIALPRGYREFLLRTNGGRPDPPAFFIKGLSGVPYGIVQAFLGLDALIESEDIEWTLAESYVRFPHQLIPIARTGTGEMLLIQTATSEGAVCYWDHRYSWGTGVWRNADMHPVADSFNELLEGFFSPPAE